MYNVQRQFNKLEQLQSVIGNKLDNLEKTFFDSNKGNLNFDFDFSQNEYKLQSDLDKLLCEDNRNKDIGNNYLRFYQHLLSSVKEKFEKENNNKKNKNFKTLKNSKNVKKFVEKGIETDKQFLLTMEKENLNLNKKKAKTLNNIDKNVFHKKQNIYLTNELVSLRCKLNKIKNKNNIMQSLLKTGGEVKNCKILDKIMTGFIEKLAINWNDIVEMLIDELIEEEVYTLNEIEIEKNNKNTSKLKLQIKNYEDLLRNCGNDKNLNDSVTSFNKENIKEINKIIESINQNESRLKDKYIIK